MIEVERSRGRAGLAPATASRFGRWTCHGSQRKGWTGFPGVAVGRHPAADKAVGTRRPVDRNWRAAPRRVGPLASADDVARHRCPGRPHPRPGARLPGQLPQARDRRAGRRHRALPARAVRPPSRPRPPAFDRRRQARHGRRPGTLREDRPDDRRHGVGKRRRHGRLRRGGRQPDPDQRQARHHLLDHRHCHRQGLRRLSFAEGRRPGGRARTAESESHPAGGRYKFSGSS